MYSVVLINQFDIYSVLCPVVLSDQSVFISAFLFKKASKLHKFEVCFGHVLVTAHLIEK